MATKKTTGSGRTRNYATVVYPESAPEDWESKLADHCISAFRSPLHDRDINPTGEPKKEHYHVMIMFEGVKTREQAIEIIESIGGVGCEIVNSVRGYARYLCHLDNPEKAQYDMEQVRCFGGADYNATIGLPTDKYRAIREMMLWCNDNGVYAYSDLLMFASEERYDWFRVLCDNGTVVIKEFLKSISWKMREEAQDRKNAEFDAKIADMRNRGVFDD